MFVFSFPKKFINITTFVCHGPPAFLLLDHPFCLSHLKTCWTMLVDNVGLRICLLGTSNSMVTVTFLPWCKPKCRTSSTTNHGFYKALGQLHGPWCNTTPNQHHCKSIEISTLSILKSSMGSYVLGEIYLMALSCTEVAFLLKYASFWVPTQHSTR